MILSGVGESTVGFCIQKSRTNSKPRIGRQAERPAIINNDTCNINRQTRHWGHRFSATSWALTYQRRSTRATMTSGSAAHRVSTISELTRLVACQLVLITGLKSAVNFACACRHLEEPVLSTLWETQSSVRTLLKVFPSENLNYDNYARTVRCQGFLLGKSTAQVQGYCSSGSLRIRRQRLGSDSSATRLGCTKPMYMRGWPLVRASSANYASIHPPADGSQRCKTYPGASHNPTFLTSTYFSPLI